MSQINSVNYKKEFSKGLLVENPVFRLALGTCPTLATTGSMQAALGMGIAATLVLVCSNIAISALRKLIPDKVRIPAYIVLIAGFVTIVQMLVKAYQPALDAQLGIYLPLIVVNCIILGRAEAFAGKNPILASAFDGLGMGIGFTAALFSMGMFREVLGSGSFFGMAFLPEGGSLAPIGILALPAGGFFSFGLLMAVANKLSDMNGLPIKKNFGCGECGSCDACGSLKTRPQAVGNLPQEDLNLLKEKQQEALAVNEKMETLADEQLNAVLTPKTAVKRYDDKSLSAGPLNSAE